MWEKVEEVYVPKVIFKIPNPITSAVATASKVIKNVGFVSSLTKQRVSVHVVFASGSDHSEIRRNLFFSENALT